MPVAEAGRAGLPCMPWYANAGDAKSVSRLAARATRYDCFIPDSPYGFGWKEVQAIAGDPGNAIGNGKFRTEFHPL